MIQPTEAHIWTALGACIAGMGLMITLVLTTMRSEFRRVDARFDAVDARFDGVNQRLDALDRDVNALTKHTFKIDRD